MIVLVLNCGSSSIKYQVIDMASSESGKLLAKGLVERIGMDSGVLTHKPQDGREPFVLNERISDHVEGTRLIFDALTDASHGVIASLDAIGAVGHRVAHGGEYFNGSVLVTDDVKGKIRSCFEIAPLHNPASMDGIEAVTKLLPKVPQVTVFDTAFHQTIPAMNYLYALPYEYYEKYRVRKYGFHGTSHRFVAVQGAKLAGLDFNHSRIITCHIGNGASVTAVIDGKSFDTSMGFSPVDGLVMGTRTGDVDPSAVIYIADKEHLSPKQASDMINKRSGIEGISGVSSDMRDVEAAAVAGNKRAAVGLDLYYNRIKKYVGAYAAEMGGVDLIVFTGGVGENNFEMRRTVCEGLEFMGVRFDAEANRGVRGTDKVLSRADSKVKVAVVQTNEELVIATDTYNITKNL